MTIRAWHPKAQRFEGKTAIVTGGSHGIGRATVQRLVGEGATVAVADLDHQVAVDLAAEVSTDAGEGSAFAVACDVRNRSSVESAVAEAMNRLGRLDALVTVAGGSRLFVTLEDTSDEQWVSDLELNLTGTMRCVRACLPHLRRSPSGSVVMIGSVNGLAAFGGEAYSAAKAGLSSLAQNLATSLGPDGVRVNVIAPGTIATRVWAERGTDHMVRAYPLGRVGQPADIASAVAFLASDDAAWITGITLPVDGGALAGPATLLNADPRDFSGATGGPGQR